MDYASLVALVYFEEKGPCYDLLELQEKIGVNKSRLFEMLVNLFQSNALAYSDNLISITDRGRTLITSNNMEHFGKDGGVAPIEIRDTKAPVFPSRFLQQLDKCM